VLEGEEERRSEWVLRVVSDEIRCRQCRDKETREIKMREKAKNSHPLLRFPSPSLPRGCFCPIQKAKAASWLDKGNVN